MIGNDHSPEDPIEIVKKYKDRLEIRYLNFEENLGQNNLVAHWERCVEYVDTEWFMILGDDDCLDINVVEAFYENISAVELKNTKVIRFATQIIDENDHENSKVFKIKGGSILANRLLFDKLAGIQRSSLSENIFETKTWAIKRFKVFPVAWHSDDLAWLEFSDFGMIKVINSAVVKIRVTSQSISGCVSNLLEKRQASLQFFEYLFLKYSEKFNKKEMFQLKLLYESHLKGKSFSVNYVFKRNLNDLGLFSAIGYMLNIFKNRYFSYSVTRIGISRIFLKFKKLNLWNYMQQK